MSTNEQLDRMMGINDALLELEQRLVDNGQHAHAQERAIALYTLDLKKEQLRATYEISNRLADLYAVLGRS